MLSLSLNAKMKSLEVITAERDLETIRNYVAEGFEEILESPVITYQDDYMEILLVPNGIATKEELYCVISLKRVENGTKIKAVPVYRYGEQVRECSEYSTRKGVYLVIEGAALACNDNIKDSNTYSFVGGIR